VPFPCGYNCNTSSLNVFVFREDGPILDKGSFVSFQLLQVVNSGWAGNPGIFQIRTLTPEGNVTIDADLSIPCPVIVPGLLLDTNFSLASYVTGESTTAIVSFSLSERNPFPNEGIITVALPEYLILLPNFQAVIRASDFSSISTQNFATGRNISFQNQGNEVAKGSLIRVVISGLRNRNTQGNTGPLSIRILSLKGAVIDQLLDFEGLTIVSGNLNDAFIAVADLMLSLLLLTQLLAKSRLIT